MNDEEVAVPASEEVPAAVETTEVEGSAEEKPVVKEKGNGFQGAIDRQTRKYYAEKGRADALQAELDRARNAAPGKNTSGATSPDDFPNLDAYNRAVILEEAGKIADLKIAQSKQAELTQATKSKWENDAKEMRKVAEDFDEVTEDFISSGKITPAMDKATLEADRPAAIVHYLANHPEEADRIGKLSDFRTAIEIGKIEAKLATQAAPKKASAAPAPITPVGAKGGPGAPDPEKESPKEFAARRNKELSLKARR